MNEPLYVPATTNDIRPLRRFAWGIGLAAIPLAFIPEVGLMFAGYAILMAALLGTSVRRMRPFVGRGVIVDEEGIAPSQDGERLWTLPWTRYGGYRWSRKKEGYEILDREGNVAFVFPGALRASMPARLALREELDRRVPEGGFPFAYAQTRAPSLRTVLIATLVGFVASGVAAWASTQSALSGLYALCPLGLFVAAGGFLVAGFEAVGLIRYARGWRPPNPALATRPEEGPSLSRHLVKHAASPVRLEEGRRYRTVDVERRREELRVNLLLSNVVWVGVVLTLGSFYGVFTEPQSWRFLAFSVLWWGSITTLGFCARNVERALHRTIDDVLWVHDGHLVVIRPAGEPLVLSLPKENDRAALRRKAWTNATDSLPVPGGGRYRLDRTRLYAAPHEIDLERLTSA